LDALLDQFKQAPGGSRIRSAPRELSLEFFRAEAHLITEDPVDFIGQSIIEGDDQGAHLPDRMRRPSLFIFLKSGRDATRYDKTPENYLASVKLASARIWMRANESMA
jgi:hypothetical protein